MTRDGKIARLPWSLRDELNRRLRDGEPGKNLVDWLNSLPAVQEVLQEGFGGRLISEQNLSEWQQGEYQDWLRDQETRTWVQELASRSEDISEDIKEEAGDLSVADLLAAPLAIALDRCQPVLAAKATEDPKQVRALLDIARELARLRRGDHSQQRLRFERERWEKNLKLKLLTIISKGGQPIYFHDFLIRTLVEMRADALRKWYADKKKRGSLSAKEETHYQEALAKIARWRDDPTEARANQHVLLAGAGSLDPEPFYNQSESTQSNKPRSC
jgi:hypothetical protein